MSPPHTGFFFLLRTFYMGLSNTFHQGDWGRRATHLLFKTLRGEPITLADDCPYAECVSFVQ